MTEPRLLITVELEPRGKLRDGLFTLSGMNNERLRNETENEM